MPPLKFLHVPFTPPQVLFLQWRETIPVTYDSFAATLCQVGVWLLIRVAFPILFLLDTCDAHIASHCPNLFWSMDSLTSLFMHPSIKLTSLAHFSSRCKMALYYFSYTLWSSMLWYLCPSVARTRSQTWPTEVQKEVVHVGGTGRKSRVF